MKAKFVKEVSHTNDQASKEAWRKAKNNKKAMRNMRGNCRGKRWIA